MKLSRGKGRSCEAAVAITGLLLVLLFAAGPATAEFDRECFNSCLTGCDGPPQRMKWCFKQCRIKCTHGAIATDSRSVTVDERRPIGH
ncbi:hypothetical protein V6N13_032796 [Hibiscus sabdariffa]|uniref:Uncharacterized protein n=1 Tax=Hibiscus sabdariffa TaxID=183260 RepID=A0ABR2FC57_9ROSI